MFIPSVRRKIIAVAGVCAILMLVFAVFALSAQDTMEEPQTINIEMSEYQYTVDGEAGASIQLESDKEYSLHFTNVGTVEHEVLIGRNAIVIQDGFHHDFEEALLGDVEVEISGEMNDEEFAIGVAGFNEMELYPGQEMTITFTLPADKAGDWEMGCFVSIDPNAATDDNPGAGHYDAGMVVAVEVVASSS